MSNTQYPDQKEFDNYCGEARNEFVKFIDGLPWDNTLRTKVDDMLICFDQMRERLSTPPQEGDAKAIAEAAWQAAHISTYQNSHLNEQGLLYCNEKEISKDKEQYLKTLI